jgi:hypothetical protein
VSGGGTTGQVVLMSTGGGNTNCQRGTLTFSPSGNQLTANQSCGDVLGASTQISPYEATATTITVAVAQGSGQTLLITLTKE